jgi:Trypsin-like peptidase domain
MTNERPAKHSPEIQKIYVDYLNEFTIRYCVPVIVGFEHSGGKAIEEPHYGTATLLQLSDRRLIVTNDHVLAWIEDESRKRSRPFVFQIGRLPINPNERLVARSRKLDLCTFRADDLDAQSLTDRFASDPVPRLEFYRVHRWPPSEAQAGDKLVWAGFPTSLRHVENGERFTVPLTFMGPVVSRVDEDMIISNNDPERKDWLVHYGEDLTPYSHELNILGGMSGGPVFLSEGPARLAPELVGLISAYHKTVHQMQISRLDGMCEDGRLLRR